MTDQGEVHTEGSDIDDAFSLLRVKMVGFVVIFVTGMLGGLMPLRLRVKSRFLSLGNVLSGGVFLAAGFAHMLSEAVEEFGEMELQLGHFPLPYVLCMIGLLCTFFLEKVAFQHQHHHFSAATTTDPSSSSSSTGGGIIDGRRSLDSSSEHSTEAAATDESGSRGFLKPGVLLEPAQNMNIYILGVVLSFHSIIEGIALGIEGEISGANSLLIAIIGHKVFDAFAFGVNLAKHNVMTRQLIKLVLIFSLTTPVGILMGLFALTSSPSGFLSATIMALSSGTFIYIALVEVLMEEFESSRDRVLKFVLVMIGALAMTVLSGHSHSHSHLEPPTVVP